MIICEHTSCCHWQVTSRENIWHVLSAVGPCLCWCERCPVWQHETQIYRQPTSLQVCLMCPNGLFLLYLCARTVLFKVGFLLSFSLPMVA